MAIIEPQPSRPLVAACLMLIQNNRILMLQRARGSQAGNWSLVAGKVDEGETAIQAMVREAREETGLILNPDDLQVACVLQRPNSFQGGRNVDAIDFYIRAEKFAGEIKNREPAKCFSIEFFDLNALPENTIPFIRHAIDMVSKKQFYGVWR